MARTAPATSRLVKPKQASRETGIPYSTLRDAVHRGELPVIKIGVEGRAWFLERADVDRWLESRKETAIA
jgi:excisionase family DNA binding protein